MCFEFPKSDFMIKEQKREGLAKGCREGDLYALNLKQTALFVAKSGKAIEELWHAHSGHPHQYY